MQFGLPKSACDSQQHQKINEIFPGLISFRLDGVWKAESTKLPQ